MEAITKAITDFTTNRVKLNLGKSEPVTIDLPFSVEDIAKFMKSENVNYTVENN